MKSGRLQNKCPRKPAPSLTSEEAEQLKVEIVNLAGISLRTSSLPLAASTDQLKTYFPEIYGNCTAFSDEGGKVDGMLKEHSRLTVWVHCVSVNMHSLMGCAVVNVGDPVVRDAILEEAKKGPVAIAGKYVQIKPYFGKDSRVEVKSDIFIAWDRQAEQRKPLPESEIIKFFEAKHHKYTVFGQSSEIDVALGDVQQN